MLKPFILAAAMLATAANAEPAAPLQAPGFYRLTVGDYRVTVLLDGTGKRDLAAIMSQPAVVRAAYDAVHQAMPVELSINCFLIDTGKMLILVDTGAGELFGPAAGKLTANLRAAGYTPESVDAVLLTHIHADHSGGLMIKGQRAFPNATVYVDAADPALWLNAKKEAAAPAERRDSFAEARLSITPYRIANRLRTFNAPTEVFPGITAVPVRGHTPGHAAYRIERGGSRLLLWGDTMHAQEAQFSRPDITIAYDTDPAPAAAARTALLTQLADSGELVGGAHLSFPGLGRVEKKEHGFTWHAEPYRAVP